MVFTKFELTFTTCASVSCEQVNDSDKETANNNR